jgi:hypothetical protein
MFIGQDKPSGIYPAHVSVIDQCTKDRLYRPAAYAAHYSCCIARDQFGMHTIVVVFVYAVINLLILRGPATTAFAKRTILTHVLATAIDTPGIGFAFTYTLKWQYSFIATLTFILILRLILQEAFTL